MATLPKDHSTAPAGDTETSERVHRVRSRYYARWARRLVILVIAVLLARTLVVNERYQWGVVWDYCFDASILKGVVTTIELTAIAMVVGVALGILLAVLLRSDDPWTRACSNAFIWFFRGTPLLVQIIFWYNLGSLYPELALKLPFGPTFFAMSANEITPLTAAILGLGLNEGAYMAEIVRGGLLAVGKGQTEAALAVGMRKRQVFRRIVLPQAMRVIVPATGNQVIGMLKTTSLVSVISLAELLYSAQAIYARTFQPIPLLIVASLWYLALTTVLTLIQVPIERRYGRGHAPTGRARTRRGPGRSSAAVAVAADADKSRDLA